tara:strand:+ start:6982 stop:7245 length:264 start_codon:yes stop_codon:yes gene_type:complete
MDKISGAEIIAMRRMIASERTSDDLKKSFKTTLLKFDVPLIVVKKENNEKSKIEEQIYKMESIMKYSDDKENIRRIIKSLNIALKYV